jgi:hypothetical protein
MERSGKGIPPVPPVPPVNSCDQHHWFHCAVNCNAWRSRIRLPVYEGVRGEAGSACLFTRECVEK